MTTEQGIHLISVLVPLLSVLVMAVAMIRRSGSESGGMRAKVKAVCESLKTFKSEILGRMKRVEDAQVRAEDHHREDVQRVFEKLETMEGENQKRHKRLRSTLTIHQRQLTALMAVNPEISAELIVKLTNGEDPQ